VDPGKEMAVKGFGVWELFCNERKERKMKTRIFGIAIMAAVLITAYLAMANQAENFDYRFTVNGTSVEVDFTPEGNFLQVGSAVYPDPTESFIRDGLTFTPHPGLQTLLIGKGSDEIAIALCKKRAPKSENKKIKREKSNLEGATIYTFTYKVNGERPYELSATNDKNATPELFEKAVETLKVR
jgi:hypothetical protein